MRLILSVALLIIFNSTVYAGDVNITADKQVEWHQKEQKVVARGNAVATKDDMNIKSDTLTGYYQPGNKGSKGKLNRVVANGNVRMHSPRADAFGDNMDYNLDKDTAVLVGKPATIKTEQETITAQENITYYPSQQKAIALGNVKAIDKDGNQLFSDKMIAFFVKGKDDSSSLTLDKVDIFGNVKIITKDATVTADKGTYLPNSGLVKLFDNIIINQEGNLLRGDKAETNLNTGISKLLAGSKTGRVKGVFKEKK